MWYEQLYRWKTLIFYTFLIDIKSHIRQYITVQISHVNY